ncbi:putative methyltransferase 235L [Halotydeus destructor]|nr:putative methyltransferase 235L [Halotydeus destructor]
MEYRPEVYDNDNAGQLKDSERFLATMKNIMGDKIVDSVVDLGCGVGNVTKLMAAQLNCNTMTGVDVDAEMIHYARAKYPAMKFHVADMSYSWPKFEQLTGITGKSVDIVVSTYAVQWLFTEHQRTNAMENVHNMLKDGARGHFLFPAWASISYLFEEYLMKSACSRDVKNPWLENSDNWLLIWSKVCSENKLDIISLEVSRVKFEAKYSFLAVLFRWHLRLSCQCIDDDENQLVGDFLTDFKQNADKGVYKCPHYEINEDTIRFDIDLFELHVEKLD